jgi:hypothetical protein
MTSFQKRMVLSLILLGIIVIALVLGVNVTSQNPSIAEANLSFSMTLDPTVVANLTSIPQATPLSDEDAALYLTFVERVETCVDYTDERRAQMRQHIEWLVAPATIPSEMLIALGTNPDSGLIFGMAKYTEIQWRILKRPAESCLIDIGRDLNLLLEAVGRPPITIYDETP